MARDARDYLSRIDRTTTGRRCDVTPLFADAAAFAGLLDDVVVKLAELQFDLVAGLDALGFIFATGIAVRSGKGVLAVRKGGKLPLDADRVEFVDYTGERKSLEIRRDAITSGTRVLVADEWIETGAQVRSAIELIERQGGVVAGVVAVNIDGDALTKLSRYRCFSIISS